MIINGNVHLFFEQSGTFKNEFKKLGYNAYDYDIQNNFGETDYMTDLFKDIETGRGVFDKIESNDLVMAFFPCIYFCAKSEIAFSMGQMNYRKKTDSEKLDLIIERNKNRYKYFELLLLLVKRAFEKNFKLIIENPWSEQTFLKQTTFLKKTDLIDNDRSQRGDNFKKPTAYWFFNCKPGRGYTIDKTEKIKIIDYAKKGVKAGICSEERSQISTKYARNFIKDNILMDPETDITLFNMGV